MKNKQLLTPFHMLNGVAQSRGDHRERGGKQGKSMLEHGGCHTRCLSVFYNNIPSNGGKIVLRDQFHWTVY